MLELYNSLEMLSANMSWHVVLMRCFSTLKLFLQKDGTLEQVQNTEPI